MNCKLSSLKENLLLLALNCSTIVVLIVLLFMPEIVPSATYSIIVSILFGVTVLAMIYELVRKKLEIQNVFMGVIPMCAFVITIWLIQLCHIDVLWLLVCLIFLLFATYIYTSAKKEDNKGTTYVILDIMLCLLLSFIRYAYV